MRFLFPRRVTRLPSLAASLVVLAVTGALLLAAGGSAVASPSSSPGSSPAAAAPPATTTPAAVACGPDAKPGPQFTLLTGDVVRLGKAADGTQCGAVVRSVGARDTVRFTLMGPDLYALTGQAVVLIAQGKVDQHLFDLTRLAADHYDDTQSATLPVITTADTHGTARPATAPSVPRGAKRTSMLKAVHGQALAVAKAQTQQAWTDLSAATGSGQKVWLDDKVKASLDVSVPAIGAPAAWAAGYDGKGIKIAVLDTGIDLNHPDFAGRIGATQSFVPGQTVQDGFGHGTHVASIAAGSGAASGGKYRGVAPGATLLAGKVLDNTGSGQESWVIAGMQWAADQGAKVANMSFGGLPDDGSNPVAQAVNQISAQTGTLFVIAAGNFGHASFGNIGWPGSADQALTVGSVAKTAPYRVSYFSSAGPRLNDYAIKPDITAPGENITAARAAGTQLGPLVGDNYTTLSGTSMATPHVAGAAAIVAEQHPDWTGQQLKDALTSTANPNDQDPVTWQGDGMVNVAHAITSPLVDTTSVNFGRVSAPWTDPVRRTVTIRNVSNHAVNANLNLTVHQMNPSLTAEQPFTPPAGAVTVSPSTVDIPAGQTATVTVAINLQPLDMATYDGWLNAGVDGTVAAHTAVTWTKSPPLHRLTVRGTDRFGHPANTTCCSWLYLARRDPAPTGANGVQITLGFWDNGVPYFLGLGTDPLLPEGRYALLGNISDWTQTAPYYRLSETIIGETNLVMDRDRSFTYDARNAQHVQFKTPRPTAPNPFAGIHVYQTWWGAPNSDGTRTAVFNTDDNGFFLGRPADVYVFPGQEPEQPGLGDRFTTSFNAMLEPSKLTLTTMEPGGPTLHPQYPQEVAGNPLSPAGSVFKCKYYPTALCNTWFDSGVHPVVDVGSGSATELAAAKPRGRLVLVHEDPAHDGLQVSGQVLTAAKQAGAVGVLYGSSDDGLAYRAVTDRYGIPVAVLPKADTQQLSSALARHPMVIRAGGQPQSPYVYWLDYQVTGPLPASGTFPIHQSQLATITARYHADQPGTLLFPGSIEYYANENLDGDVIVAPFTRTEYLLGGVRQRYTLIEPDRPDSLTVQDGIRQYPAGASDVQDYNGAPLVPVPGADGAVVSGSGPFLALGTALAYGTGQLLSDFTAFGQSLRITTSKDGHVLCDDSFFRYCNVGGQPGTYQIRLQVPQPSLRAGKIDTTWQIAEPKFTAGFDTTDEPGVNLTYSPALDGMLNSVRAGSRYELPVSVRYQPGYTGTSSGFTVAAWVSHDHGATWQALGTQQTGRSGTTSFWISTPHDAQATSIRVKAADTTGNFEDQTLIDAWPVTPAVSP
jgi:subtilisin family serine protease